MPEFSPVVLPFNDETAASFAAQNMTPPTRSLMAAMMDFSWQPSHSVFVVVLELLSRGPSLGDDARLGLERETGYK